MFEFLPTLGFQLSILFLMTSAPVAAASFIIVSAMRGNYGLATNIIVITTLGSLFATRVGIALLRGMGLL